MIPTRFYWIILALAATGLGFQGRAFRRGLLLDYYPAACHPAPFASAGCSLSIFRQDKLQTTVELPVRLDFLSYVRRGNALYGLWVLKRPPCFYRLDLDLSPVAVRPLACREDLLTAFDLTVSDREDFLLVSGIMQEGGLRRCGVFEFRLPGLETRQVLDAGTCESPRFESAWTSLSVSPDGSQAVAVRHNRLELVDVTRQSARPVAEGIAKAGWSPDGDWIAALDLRGRTELLDTRDFKVRRTMAGSEVQWSPDSRYLLRVRPCFFPIASNGVGTIEALEVATGKSVQIQSSKCAVDNHSTGWVSANVLR